jgi:DNA-binding MarR family transcriptional regulator
MTKMPASLKDTHVFFVCRACDVLQDRADAFLATGSAGNLGLRRRWILLAIEDQPLSQKEICDILNVNTNVMVELIDDLEKRGYVTRVLNPANRRSHLISLTSAGKQLNTVWRTQFDEIIKHVYQPLNRSEAKQLRNLCARILDSDSVSKESDV